MKLFLAIVEQDDDSAYGIRFPDVPGCFSAADEADDILPNAIEALRLYEEDEPLPEPSGHSELVARADVREALAEGGYLIAVPLIENDTAVVRANVTFERGMLKAIDQSAKRLGLTRSAFLASAARDKIEMRSR